MDKTITTLILFALVLILPLSSTATAETSDPAVLPPSVQATAPQTVNSNTIVAPTNAPVSPEVPAPVLTKPITLALVGDILMDSWVGTEIKKQDVDYPWAQVKPILSRADLAIGNLESVVGVSGAPIKGKSFTFRARPETLQGVVNAGIDVVGLANNHVLDYGPVALAETLKNLDQYSIARTGAGMSVYEAFAPAIKEVNGVKVGVLSFSRVVPYEWWIPGHVRPGVANGWDIQKVLETIKRVDGQVDVLVVSIHWGKELADYPGQDQVKLARAMIDAGADTILGHHPHCLQGIEVYNGKPVFL